MTVDEVRQMLQRMCGEAGSQREWARTHNISHPFVSRVLRGQKAPTPRLLAEMEMREVVSYEPIGAELAKRETTRP
jgi:hypothetical protein